MVITALTYMASFVKRMNIDFLVFLLKQIELHSKVNFAVCSQLQIAITVY